MVAETTYEFIAPGFKKTDRKDGSPLEIRWQAADDAIAAGYPIKSVPIKVDLSEPQAAIDKIVEECGRQQAEMLAWLDGDRDDRARLAVRFIGTIESLIDCYQSDEDSAYAEIQENTAQGYDHWLKMIRETVGKRLVAKLVAKEFRRWYRRWKLRASKRGHDGARTAYGGIQALRLLFTYGIESGIEKCRVLRSDMDKMRFRRNGPREETLSYDEAKALVEEAIARGWENLALSQALQFELFLRQKDVIGSWTKVAADYVPEPGEIVLRGKVWRGLTLDMITLDSDLRIRTSKTGQPVIHRLTECELVIRALRAFPSEQRNGPVACRPDGTPWPDRQAYAKDWRKVADAVGISKQKQNMDSRASGISEASEAGVSDDDLQRQTGHKSPAMIQKVYKRLGGERSRQSHVTRKRYREKNTTLTAAE
jgi:integrase